MIKFTLFQVMVYPQCLSSDSPGIIFDHLKLCLCFWKMLHNFCHVLKTFIFISLPYILNPNSYKFSNNVVDKRNIFESGISHQLIYLIIKFPTFLFLQNFWIPLKVDAELVMLLLELNIEDKKTCLTLWYNVIFLLPWFYPWRCFYNYWCCCCCC